MTIKTVIYISIFSVLSLCGIALKIVLINPVESAEYVSDPLSYITPTLNQNGYWLRHINQPTVDKNFSIGLYQRTQCSGYLILLPLPRNAEAKHLLNASFPSLKSEIYFIFRGEKFTSFPTVLFWWQNLKKGLSGSNNKLSIVWSVSETSPCVDAGAIHRIL